MEGETQRYNPEDIPRPDKKPERPNPFDVPDLTKRYEQGEEATDISNQEDSDAGTENTTVALSDPSVQPGKRDISLDDTVVASMKFGQSDAASEQPPSDNREGGTKINRSTARTKEPSDRGLVKVEKYGGEATSKESTLDDVEVEFAFRKSLTELPKIQKKIEDSKRVLLGDPDADAKSAFASAIEKGDITAIRQLTEVMQDEERLTDLLQKAEQSPAYTEWGSDQHDEVALLTTEFQKFPKEIRALKRGLFGNPDANTDEALASLGKIEDLSQEQKGMLEELQEKESRLADIPEILRMLRREIQRKEGKDDDIEKVGVTKLSKEETAEFEKLYEGFVGDVEKWKGGNVVDLEAGPQKRTVDTPQKVFDAAELDMQLKFIPEIEQKIARTEIDAAYEASTTDRPEKKKKILDAWGKRIEVYKQRLDNRRNLFKEIGELREEMTQGPGKGVEQKLIRALTEYKDLYEDLAATTEDPVAKDHSESVANSARTILDRINGDPNKNVPPDEQYLKDVLRFEQLKKKQGEVE